MQDFIDGDTVFSDILMMRQVDNKIVVVLEGPEDVGIVDPHLNFQDCRSEIAHGKQSVLRVAELCEESGLSHVFCVVDRDFGSDEDLTTISNRISISENYDLLADIFMNCHDAVDRVIASHVDRATYTAHIDQVGTSAHGLIVHIAAHVGCIRYAAVVQGHALHTAGFPVRSLIEAHEKSRLLEEAATIAKGRSPSCALTLDAVVGLIESNIAASGNLARLCNSHDIANLLGALMRDRWGGPSGAGAASIERALRSALDWECFQKLRVCADLRRWSSEIDRTAWRRDVAA